MEFVLTVLAALQFGLDIYQIILWFVQINAKNQFGKFQTSDCYFTLCDYTRYCIGAL